MPKRTLLMETIKQKYGTQDRCAYALHINQSILSRIVGCTKDPTTEQVEILCKFLHLSPREGLSVNNGHGL